MGASNKNQLIDMLNASDMSVLGTIAQREIGANNARGTVGQLAKAPNRLGDKLDQTSGETGLLQPNQ